MRLPIIGSAMAAFAAAIVLGACEAPGETTGLDPRLEPVFNAHSQGVVATATGGGQFDAGVAIVQFAFSAVQKNAAGDATGQLRFSTALGGVPIEFHGRVTCMTTDPVERRAWVGGVVTQNNSEHAAFTTDIHQPGRDIWFRVVDYGEGAGAPQVDRTTFVGFEGAAGIITSPEYCETQPWPEGDERTSPVIDGNIQVNGG